jgi:hypothetical protein
MSNIASFINGMPKIFLIRERGAAPAVAAIEKQQ